MTGRPRDPATQAAIDFILKELELARPMPTLREISEKTKCSIRTAAYARAHLRAKGKIHTQTRAPRVGPKRASFSDLNPLEADRIVKDSHRQDTEGVDHRGNPATPEDAELKKREEAESMARGHIMTIAERLEFLSNIVRNPSLRPEIRVAASRAMAVVEAAPGRDTGPSDGQLTLDEREFMLTKMLETVPLEIATRAFQAAFNCDPAIYEPVDRTFANADAATPAPNA